MGLTNEVKTKLGQSSLPRQPKMGRLEGENVRPESKYGAHGSSDMAQYFYGLNY